MFHFFLKAEPIIPSVGVLILIKRYLILFVEQIFRLVEISFRNRLHLCLAKNKLLMQNIASVNIN